MGELLFTPAAILDLLSKIDELKDVDVGVSETSDDHITISVGQSTYLISGDEATTIQVDSDALNQVEDANLDAYQSLSDSGEVELLQDEEIKGGVIKEFAKTLLVGGLVRLTSKLLRPKK